tara:strand:- start:2027 stop:2578 length:552 start_codon:yes stop_codon:yes gene_type:complete
MSSSKSVSNWSHSAPKKYYAECVKMFGKPLYVANVKHGSAMWLTKGLFAEHFLRDEYVSHCVPAMHYDFFYSTIHFHVPEHKLQDVLKISGSILYDGLKKHLTARCGSIEANYATLYIGQLVSMGKLSIKQVKSNNMYKRMIKGEIMPYEQMKKEMSKLKTQNRKKYRAQLKHTFSDYSFKSC